MGSPPARRDVPDLPGYNTRVLPEPGVPGPPIGEHQRGAFGA